jgi:hypothetical protein
MIQEDFLFLFICILFVFNEIERIEIFCNLLNTIKLLYLVIYFTYIYF